MERLSDVRQILSMDPYWIDKKSMCATRAAVSVILASAAAIMLVLNIINDSTIMAYSSVVLVVGFLMSAFVSGILKKPVASGAMIAVLVCFVLTVFAVSGGNGGFAILWILLVPLFSISLLGVNEGIGVASYFLVFLVVLFFSPLSDTVADKYTAQFMSRFPVLYTCDYCVSLLLSVQKEYYYRKAHIQMYMDALTGVYNRRFFMEEIQKETDGTKNIGVMLIDVNGLKAANDTLGHEAGDELIRAVPECCRKVFGNDMHLCRIGGDEFACVLKKNSSEVQLLLEQLRKTAEEWHGQFNENVHFAVGWASAEEFPECDLTELLKKADSAMYADKIEYYKIHDRRKG